MSSPSFHEDISTSIKSLKSSNLTITTMSELVNFPFNLVYNDKRKIISFTFSKNWIIVMLNSLLESSIKIETSILPLDGSSTYGTEVSFKII